MRINVSADENYPYYFVRFPSDPVDAGTGPFVPNAELSEADAADLLRVRTEHWAWQEKLARLLGDR